MQYLCQVGWAHHIFVSAVANLQIKERNIQWLAELDTNMQAWKFRGAYISTCKTLFPLLFCSGGCMRVNRELERHAECTMKIVSWKQAQIHPVTCMNFGFRWTRQQVRWQRPRSPQCTWQLPAMWQAPSPVSTLTPFCLQGCGSLAPGKGWPLLLCPLFLLILFSFFFIFSVLHDPLQKICVRLTWVRLQQM